MSGCKFNQRSFSYSVPDWALHCTENPEITVQYISDSGAVQLSRHCQDSVKEISCQGKMNQMAMYDELKCPEELTTVAPTEITTVEFASTTNDEIRPEVIIKNPQKMLEDVFNNIEENMEVDSNRLDVADAKKELDLMVGDQPAADLPEDKKTLLKLPEKKEVYPKKSKNSKKDSKVKDLTMDDEPMMGDAPAEEVHDEHLTTISSKPDSSTTDRQRRDAVDTTLPAEAKFSTELPASNQHSGETTTEDSSTIATDLTTEVQQITSVVTEEATTKNIVQGHPLFHNHAVFKEPISVDNNNGTLERKDVSNSDDHFIPPMLLVKARFTATKSTEGTEETKEMTTDISTSTVTESILDGQTVTETSDDDKNATSKPVESSEVSANEIPSITQLETTPAVSSIAIEKPIVIEKRNDPRLGLKEITTTTQATSTNGVQLSSTEAQSPSTTDEPITITEEASSSVSYESSVSEISTTESQTETSELMESSSSDSPTSTRMSDISTSTQPEPTAERLIESTTEKLEASSPLASSSVTPIAIKLTTLKAPETSSPKPMMKSSIRMRNDIDESHRGRDDSSESSHEMHENSDENGSYEHHHLENNLNNADNFQPYKPNRHRSMSKLDHHHGPAFSIGKILG